MLNDNLIKELAFDSILNRYLMIGLQTIEPSMETVKKIEYVSAWVSKRILLGQFVISLMAFIFC